MTAHYNYLCIFNINLLLVIIKYLTLIYIFLAIDSILITLFFKTILILYLPPDFFKEHYTYIILITTSIGLIGLFLILLILHLILKAFLYHLYSQEQIYC